MGCKFTREKEAPPGAQKSKSKPDPTPKAEEPLQRKSSFKSNPKSENAAPHTPPSPASPFSPIKQPLANELAASDSNALDDETDPRVSPHGPRKAASPPNEGSEDSDGGEGSGNPELNGSFANVDLNGSFHIHYNTKGDIIPNATLPESRRGRSVSPKLLAALSPHPSDDDLVLICTDCGATIDENTDPLCPLSGKLHV